MKFHCDRQSVVTCTVKRKQLEPVDMRHHMTASKEIRGAKTNFLKRKQLEPVDMLRCKGISQSITLYAANVCLADRYASKLKCEVLLQKIQESMSL